MLLPITGQVEATASMIFFAGIYYGAMYGGSTTSILLNTPGETGTMVTALEGFKMAKNGRAGAALATSAIGSFVAGTFATVLVTMFAPILAEYAVRLGPPEYFCLMLLVPLLTLGIPTSVTAAILLSALQNYGIQAGPQLFQTSPDLVWALIASLYIGNVMLLVLNLPMVGLWVKLLKIPRPQLYAGILIFATVGVYGMRQSSFDLFLMYGLGLVGVVMRRYDFPTAPVIVGLILGPLAEAQMRNALSIGQGSWSVFVERPMSATLLAVVVLVLVTPRLLAWHRRS
jgi:TctA family transporter